MSNPIKNIFFSRAYFMFGATFQKMQQDVLFVLQRFPLAVISSLALTTFALTLLSFPDSWIFHLNISALCALFLLSILWFVSIKLFAESRKGNDWLVLGIAVPVCGLMGTYLYNLSALFYPVTLLGFGFVLLVMIAPFLRKGASPNNIWVYHYQLWSHFFFSFLVSLILGCGVSFLLISLDYLFYFKLFNDQYRKLFVVMGCFFLPMMAMVGIPSRFDETPTPQQGKGIQLLLDYVMTPILLVFALMMTVYAIKILVLQNLPRGKVAYLVSILGVVGTLAFVLGEKEGSINSLTHRLFKRHFFHLMVIPLSLMGIGIGVRIHQYGFTAHRYAVALLFLWLSLCTLYSFIFSREKLTRFMLVSAASLLVLGSFGPWGIVEMSAQR